MFLGVSVQRASLGVDQNLPCAADPLTETVARPLFAVSEPPFVAANAMLAATAAATMTPMMSNRFIL